MEKWIATLLWDSQAALEEERVGGMNGSTCENVEIYRMKGVLDLGGEAMRLVTTDRYTYP